MSLTRRIYVVNPPDESRIVMETAIKVAFATTDMLHVNQHFGSAQSFSSVSTDFKSIIFKPGKSDIKIHKVQIQLAD